MNNRLKSFRKFLKLSQDELANKLNIPIRTYRGYEYGERNISEDVLKKLSNSFCVNLNWLISDIGEMFTQNDKNCTFSKTKINDNVIPIPILGDIEASMGNGLDVYNELQTGTYYITSQFVKSLGINPKATHMIFARGNSMCPTLENGDSLLVDTSYTDIYDGKIYCVRLNNQLYAKRLQKISQTQIKVISDNKDYDPIIIDLSSADNDFKVIGIVKWSARVH